MFSVAEILAQAKALLTGHFVLKSGKHAHYYVNKDELYTDPSKVARVGDRMAAIIWQRCQELGLLNETIIIAAPATGGIALTQWTGYFLQERGVKILAVYAEKKERSLCKCAFDAVKATIGALFVTGQSWHEVGSVLPGDEVFVREPGFEFRRGYSKHIEGRWVAVLEDILTTGTSAKETCAAVVAAKGNPFITVAICDRSTGDAKVTSEFLGVPYHEVLVKMPLETFDADKCPYCAADVPVNTDVGHGAAFVAAQAQKKV